MDKWEYSRTAESYIGMNEETGELHKEKMYRCPKCGDEASEWSIVNNPYNYCPVCGNRNAFEKE